MPKSRGTSKVWVLPLVMLLAGWAIQGDDGTAADRGEVGVVERVQAMQARRAAHTATTLPDGRVLVVGGFVEKGTALDTEIFEPARNAFVPGPTLSAVRHSHTATRLGDGRVLIAGGYGEGTRTLADAEVFDPRTGQFTPVAPLVTARANHTAVALSDGTILISGGLGEGWTYLATAELFDPSTSTFTQVGPMTAAREGHAAVRLADGRVLVGGGHEGPRRNLTLHASAEVYEPGTRTFRAVGSMRVRRHKHDAVLLLDGRVLVSGGSDERDDRGAYASTEFFDPLAGTFVSGPRCGAPATSTSAPAWSWPMDACSSPAARTWRRHSTLARAPSPMCPAQRDCWDSSRPWPPSMTAAY